MSEKIPVNVTIQVEHLAGQLVRGRPLGPWKIQAVGASTGEVCRKLERRLEKILPDSLPVHYFEGGLPVDHERWMTSVALKPEERSNRWVEPVQIDLESFRWSLRNGHNLIRVPAVGCTLIGKPQDLDDSEVTRQATIALIRLAEDLDLMALRQRFARRAFEMKSLRIQVPVNAEHEKHDDKKKFRRKTSTLRSAASELSSVPQQRVYGLDERARDLAEHLVGESPQSVLLVGPAGVGKSSLVHRMVAMANELGLGERKVWATSGARIVSGMSGLGMWQQRCSKLIRQAHATNAIVHLGSLSELMESGKIDGQPGVASMIRQAIGRRRLLAIAECTPEQLSMIERDDPILLRVFTRMELKEPGSKQTIEILRKATEDTAQRGSFSDQAVEELYRLHSRFATYSALPATALRLMRTMQDQTHPIQEYQAADVARAFARQTGLPNFLVDDTIGLDLDRVRSTLAANVVGQSEPIDLIVNLIATLKARLVRPGRPLASLMFIGPTGVGKTEMAKAIARLLYSDTRRMIRIDMSEYSSPWAAAKLIGKPGEGDGTLTSPIREQPFSVVLLDEFEKADPNVFDLLLQLLGEGRLTDSQGRLADFRNAVVIMTSNLGAESFRDASFGFGDGEAAGWREHFAREVRKFVRPEFLGRLDRIVPFRPLSKEVVRQITRRELELLEQRAGLKYSDNTLSFAPEAIELLSVIGYQPKYGARPLRRAIEEHVTVPVANHLSRLSNDSTWCFHVGARNGAVEITPEKKSTKTTFYKETEAAAINFWQRIGAMARAAKLSGPLRTLENELERNQRHIGVLQMRLKIASGPRRISAIKDELTRSEAAVEVARRLHAKLLQVVEDINQKRLQLLVGWHSNQSIDWEGFIQLGKSLLSQLKQTVEDVLKGCVTNSDTATLLVTGQGKAQMQWLWKAYQMLADEHGWRVDHYLVKPYDSLLDQGSPEHRKRASEKRVDLAGEATWRPDLSLMSVQADEGGKPVKICDLYRVENREIFTERLDFGVGFLLQVRGEGAGSWLENEHGMVHFFDASATNTKRRIRLKVSVFLDRLSGIRLSSDWLETVATPDRDPRRLFSIATQEVVDHSGRRIKYAQGKQSSGLLELMGIEHEMSLWRAIGFDGLPAGAQLSQDTRQSGDLEVPF